LEFIHALANRFPGEREADKTWVQMQENPMP